MASQLNLIHSAPEPGDGAPGDSTPTPRPTDRGTPAPARRAPAGPRTSGTLWRLDRRTIDRGRRGVEEARAELRGAAARAHEREQQRHESRLAQLEQLRRSAGAPAPTTRPSDAGTARPSGDPTGPDPSHRAA